MPHVFVDIFRFLYSPHFYIRMSNGTIKVLHIPINPLDYIFKEFIRSKKDIIV